MDFFQAKQFGAEQSNSPQVFVPVTVAGRTVHDVGLNPVGWEWVIVDNAGGVIAKCFSEGFAKRIATLVNQDAGFGPGPYSPTA